MVCVAASELLDTCVETDETLGPPTVDLTFLADRHRESMTKLNGQVMDYISYLRVSTSRQGDSGLGLEAQREAVNRFLKTTDGRLVLEFQEIETGKGSNALSKRPQLRAALDLARREKMTLIVAKLDRLTRSARLLLELVELSGGANLVFCDLPDVPSGPVGKFMLTQLAAVAEFEAGMISQRTKAALAAAKARGIKLGLNGAKLAIVRKQEADDHATTLADDFAAARAAGCCTLRDIGLYLTTNGVLTRDGGAWHPTTVARVMSRLASAAT